jgi:hypothetical protein
VLRRAAEPRGTLATFKHFRSSGSTSDPRSAREKIEKAIGPEDEVERATRCNAVQRNNVVSATQDFVVFRAKASCRASSSGGERTAERAQRESAESVKKKRERKKMGEKEYNVKVVLQ